MFKTNHKGFIAGLLFISFLVAANLAWLNPRPGFEPLQKFSQTVPLFWQYNSDVETFIITAADWPESYRNVNTLIQRPAYIFGAAVVRSIFFGLWPQSISLEQATMISYLLLNVILSFLYGFCVLKLLSRYIPEKAAKLAVGFSLFHYFALESIGLFHTNLLQFINPIFVLYFFDSLARNYSTKKNIFYSIVVGVLMLAKENYAIYLACLLVAVCHRKYWKAVLSFVVQFIPLLVWLGYLKLLQIPYYHHGYEAAGAVSWLIKDFIHLPVLGMMTTIGRSWLSYLIEFSRFYTFFAPLSLLGLWYFWRQPKKERSVWLFTASFFGMIWLQMFVANRHYAYMTADLGFLVFGFSSLWLFKAWPGLLKKSGKYALIGLGGLWLGVNIFSFLHWPWAHPSEQNSYSEEEINNLNNYRATHPTNNLQFYPKLIYPKAYGVTRTARGWDSAAHGLIQHDLSETSKPDASGCRTYFLASPFIIIEGQVSLKEPEKIKEIEWAIIQDEWRPGPQPDKTVIFSQPFGGKQYFLKLCPHVADDFSYEDGMSLTTVFQYNRALWPLVK